MRHIPHLSNTPLTRLLLTGTLLLLTACQPSVPAAPTPTAAPPAPTAAPTAATPLRLQTIGLHVFVWGHPDSTARDLKVVRQAGATWQKSVFAWREIEGSCKGCFDWREADRVVQASQDAGVKVLARIDFPPKWARADGARNGKPDNPQDYADFVAAVVARYAPGSPHGTVDAVEVWNEPNLQREWGGSISAQSAADYVLLLKRAYREAKAVNPAVKIVTAGLSPTGWDDDTARPDDQYLQWLYDAGMKAGQTHDVLGLHGNGQAPDPLAEPGSLEGFGHPSFYFRRLEQLRAIQERNGDGQAPVWVLEFGWTADAVHDAFKWFAVSEEKKADNILTALRYARANWPWLEGAFIWTLPDPEWRQDREEYWWAIANPDGTPRPALQRLIATAGGGLLGPRL